MKLFSCMFRNKIQRGVSILVAVAILLSALFICITPTLLSVKADGDNGAYALRLEPGSTGMPWFGQWVTLEKGETYVFSNCYLPDTDLYHRIYYKHANNQYDLSDLEGETVTDTLWSKQGTKFTVPTDAPDDGNGTVAIWVGIRGYKNSQPLYYYNFTLCNEKEPDINLLKDGLLAEGGSEIKADTWKTPNGNYVSAKYSEVMLQSIGGEDLFKIAQETGDLVLKLEPNSTGMPWFGQWVTLEKGKTYVFSNCYLPGTDLYHRICYKHSNNQYDGSDLTGEIVSDTIWSKQGTKFTVPADAPDDGNGKTLIYVGIRGYKINQPLYFYDFELYDVENPDVNLLKDPDLSEGGSEIKADTWKTPTGNYVSTKYSEVSLDSIGGSDVFKRAEAAEPMALKLEPNSTAMPWFGQWVTLEKGKTYVFSNCYLAGTDVYHRIYYKHADNQYDLSDLEGETVFDTLWSRQGTKFTVPTDAPDDGNGKTKIWVGIRGYKIDKPLYFYSFKLYDAENPNVNLLQDGDLLVNGTALNKAVWQTPGGEVKSNYSKVTLASIGGEDIFKIEQPQGAIALKLEANTSGMPFFGQNVSLKAGKTYVFSNCYIPYTLPNQMVCYVGSETKIETEVIEDIEWSRQGIKFTVPEDADNDPNISGNKLLWVGFRGNKSDNPLYYYDFKLYDVEEPNVNLLKDSSLTESGWYLNKSVWVSPYGNVSAKYSKVELEKVGGVDIFKKPMSEKPMALTLAPETTGMPFFGQWVNLEKGKTYVFSTCFLPGTDVIQNVYVDALGTELTDYDITYDKTWSKRNMKFTVPENLSGKARLWVGIRGYSYDGYLYYYNFELYDVENPTVNLMRDSLLKENNEQINTTLWTSPYNTAIKPTYAKVDLELLGGEDTFIRKGDVGPKMMYYTRTNRGPNHETYGCFTISIPENLRVKGQNYILQFDARSTKGVGLSNFRCGAIVPELALDENNTIAPASIKGYTYTFNLRFTENTEKKLSFMTFIPEGAEGYISNIYIYEADSKFNKVSDRDLFRNEYGDFSQYEVGNYVELYAKQGGCIDTETGLLEPVPQYFFDIAPNVAVPSGDKMLSYASVWGAGTIIIDLPHTAKKGSIDGKNYVVSITIRPTKGRDPSKFFSTGINGEHVQVYPVSVEGYKYTFNLTERYNFSLVLEYPIDCEGYISNLQMFEADMDFKPVNSVNLATAFGKNGKFADTTLQQGMEWEGIEFKGGFVNTFIDTRALEKELKNGTLGEYSSTGGIWPIPANYFEAQKDEGWADIYGTDSAIGKGTVKGKIVDSLGSPISNCTVVLKSMQGLIDPNKATPDKNGEFCFEGVPVDGYEVSIITKSGIEVLGDMFLWIEEEGDVVELSLVYNEGEDLSVFTFDDTTDNSGELLPEENTDNSTEISTESNTNPENNKKPSGASNEKDNNVLMWVLIGTGALVVLVAAGFVILFVRRKKKI